MNCFEGCDKKTCSNYGHDFFQPDGCIMPWEKGHDGWDNYSDYIDWLKEKMGPDHDEWVDSSPTMLMAVFSRFAMEIPNKYHKHK